MTIVTIKDQLPGTGKSTKMIEDINNSSEDARFIIVLPFLEECHRYAGTILDPDSGDKQLPMKDERGDVVYTGGGCNASGRRFKHPSTSWNQSKVSHVEDLVKHGEDIVTTHAALKLFTPETRDAIKDNGYTLIIDEELECIRPIAMKADRRKMLLTSGAIAEDEDTGLLQWNKEFDSEVENEEDDLQTGLSWEQRVRRMCLNGSLLLIPDENGDRKMFMWEYPVEFIRAFDEIIVLTYMMEGSVFEKYLKFYNIPYIIERGIQLPDNPFELINVVDNENMNRVGNREHAFSAKHCRSLSKEHAVTRQVKKNLENYFKNSTYGKSGTNDRLWTTVKDSQSVLKGRGYSKRFIPCNTKAVNDYRDTYQVAYIYNPHLSPDIFNHLARRGEEYAPDTERFMLTEMLQLIYRTRIRMNQPINLYVPSSRCRDALEDWMHSKE